MKRTALNLLFSAAIAAAALQAQNPMTEEAKTAYQPVKANLLKAAQKMPDSAYGFKPTPDVRSFGELIAHAAEAQTAICGLTKGVQPKLGALASVTSKADLVAALKASNDYCDGVYNSMNDQDGAEIVKTPFGPKAKLGVLNFNVEHDAETYGTIAVYLRLKGIVPPSSEGK